MDTNLHHLQFPNQMYCWSRQLQFPRHILTSFQLSFDHENISNFGLGSNMLVGYRQKCKEICDTWNSPREHKSDKSMYMLFDIRCMQALTGVGQSQSNPGNNKCISRSLSRYIYIKIICAGAGCVFFLLKVFPFNKIKGFKRLLFPF